MKDVLELVGMIAAALAVSALIILIVWHQIEPMTRENDDEGDDDA